MIVPLGDTYYFTFSTRAFATGIPTTLAGTPVLSVKEEGNDTIITSGVSVDVDTGATPVAGLHEASIVATTGNGYEVGKYYSVYVSTGTVGGISVVGETVGHFRVGPAEDAGAGIPDVNVTHFGDTAGTFASGIPDAGLTAGAVDLIWDEAISGHLTAGTAGLYVAIAGSVLVDTTITGTPTTTDFDFTGGSTSNDFYNDKLVWIISGTGIGQVRPILSSSYSGGTTTLTFDEALIVTPASGDRIIIQSSHVHPISQIVDLTWDEVLTGATHNVTNSAGKRLRGVDDAFEVHSGTAQAGAAGTITLDAGASATDDIYRGDRIVIVGGTGEQEHGICTAYNGTTKVATMAENWVITPDATSEFEVVPADADVETWQHNVVTASASGLPDVNVNEVGDTAQTAGDLTSLITTVDTVVDNLNLGIIYGSAQTGTLSTTQATSDLTGYTDDQLIGRVIIWTSGAADGEGTDITDYASASGLLTFTALTTVPGNGDTFKIV